MPYQIVSKVIHPTVHTSKERAERIAADWRAGLLMDLPGNEIETEVVEVEG